MPLYREQGVVLRTMRLGEADRIVTLVTPGRGKVRAVAKGVRKTKSRFGGRLEPMNHVDLLLYEGRELDVISQAETLEQFRSVREDLDRLHNAPLMVPAFFLKLLSLEGFHPLLDVCGGCGSSGELVAFDVGEGGALCRSCAGQRGALAVTSEALVLVRRVLGGDLAAVLREPASRSTAEVDRLATRALEHHLERRLRSVAVLDRG
ncbi:MAG: DNA repair protein RecO [Actinobacteria bacterium]|nr:DNA repair protein RecO [Actinomycetota bacterium]